MTLCDRRFLCLLFAFLVTALDGSAQADKAFDSAKQSMERAVKSSDPGAHRAAVELLAQCKDVRGVKEFRVAINKVRSSIADIHKKLDPLSVERGKLTEDLAKRVDAQGRLFVGNAGNLPKKLDEITAKILPLEDSLKKDHDFLDALIAGTGRLITSFDPADQEAQTNELLDQVDKLRNEDDKLVYIDILGRVRTPQSSAGLGALVINSTNPAIRIRALDSLALLGDSTAAAATTQALGDEYWQVRTAAINALSRFGSIEAIPVLIDRFEKEEGRLKDDILAALTSMTGVTFHDNVVIWRDWWTKTADKAKSWVADVASDNSVARSTALDQAADAGFLLAIRKAMDFHGLSMTSIRRDETTRKSDPEGAAVTPGGKDAGGVDPEEQARLALCECIGRAIGSRDPLIAQAAFDTLLVQPFLVSKDPMKRSTLLDAMGAVATKFAASFLGDLVRSANADQSKLTSQEMQSAVAALGQAASEKEHLERLLELFKSPAPVASVIKAAAAALSAPATAESVEYLLRAWTEVDASVGDRRTKLDESVPTLKEKLAALTKAAPGDDYNSWVVWWRKNKKDFKTERDVAIAKNPAIDAKRADDTGGTSFYGIKTHSLRLCFVLDVSGSMNEPAEYAGGTRTKIDVAKEELQSAIVGLPNDALFNIVFYSSTYKVWKKTLVQATPEIKKEAKAWIEGVTAEGATNIYDSLAKAFELAGRGSIDKQYELQLDTIFFLSDGQPTAGRILDPRTILVEILGLNSLKKVRIHAIGVGRDHDRVFMKELADRTGGVYLDR